MRQAPPSIRNRALPIVLVLAGLIAPGRADDSMLLGLPRAEYQARRSALMTRIKTIEADRPGPDRVPLIVLKGAARVEQEDYEEGRFRQSNPFAYLTGVEVPGACLLLRPIDGGATLYLPPRGHAEPASRDEDLGFACVASTDRFLGEVFSAIGADGANRAVVYLISPEPKVESNSQGARFARLLREGAPRAEFKDLAPALGELRKAKSDAELSLIREAIDITGAAQSNVLVTIAARSDMLAATNLGLYEYQLEAKIIGTFLDRGAMRPGFASIVGSGPNATIPHYFDNRRRIADGDLVVVDIGAEYHYYTADITRTYPANGRFTPRQRDIYQLVLDTQADVARRMKPGETRLREVTGWAREFMSKSPLRARDRDGKKRSMEHFFIHGLSHYLGMDVHDVGDWDEPIQVGEVFTIEPGIYIKEENIGVRIEDDYLMTEHGAESLSGEIPSDPDEIVRRMGAVRNDIIP